jgi:hypothetical protein
MKLFLYKNGRFKVFKRVHGWMDGKAVLRIAYNNKELRLGMITIFNIWFEF